MAQVRQRNDDLDAAKGLGMILVMLGHALELYRGDGPHATSAFAVWKFIYAFHMPLFFVLAGMATPTLAGVQREKALAGALHLTLLAAALQLLFAPLRLALPWPGEAPPTSLPAALQTVFWPAVKLEGYAVKVIWFLPCLALVRLSVWRMANGTRRAAFGIVALLAALGLAAQILGVGYFQLRTILVGAAFFALGQRLAAMKPDRLPRAACWTVLTVGLAVTALTFDLNHGCPLSLTRTCSGLRGEPFGVLMVSGSFGFLPLFALTSLSGAAAILAAATLLTASTARRGLTLIGRHTLELLIVNGAALVFVQPFLAPAIAGITPPLVLTPFILAQLAAAAAAHPVLSGFITATARLSRRCLQAQSRSPASPRY